MSKMQPDEIRSAREKLGLTQEALSVRLGLKQPWGKDAVRAWESGKTPIQGPAALAIRFALELEAEAESEDAIPAPTFAKTLLDGLWTGA